METKRNLEILARMVLTLRRGKTIVLGNEKTDKAVRYLSIQYNRVLEEDELSIRCTVTRNNKSSSSNWGFCEWTLDGLYKEASQMLPEEIDTLLPLKAVVGDNVASKILLLNEKPDSGLFYSGYPLVVVKRQDKEEDDPDTVILKINKLNNLIPFSEMEFADSIVLAD